MTNLSKRLNKVVAHTLAKNPIIPVKTELGILVGDVLIVSEGSIKHLHRNDRLLYSNIYLNDCAVKMANLLALRQQQHKVDSIYRADQDYGRYFVECQMLFEQRKRARQHQQYDKADWMEARYIEAKIRADAAKKHAQCLALI